MNEVRSSVLIINNVTHSHALTLILLKQGRICWKPASYQGRSRLAARKANVGQRRSGAKQRFYCFVLWAQTQRELGTEPAE